MVKFAPAKANANAASADVKRRRRDVIPEDIAKSAR